MQVRLKTVMAVAGTRGTGVYLEAEPDVTYFCLCYGQAELESKAFPGDRRTFVTRHHEEPCYVLGAGARRSFLKAPMLNHTDEELVALEALTGTTAPLRRRGRDDLRILSCSPVTGRPVN